MRWVVSLAVIVAEFHYWDYGEFSKTSMMPRPEIKSDELERIARGFNVKVEARKRVASYAGFMGGMRLPSYRRVDVFVSGERASDVKGYVGEIFKLYGKPDEVPRALFGGKRAGKKIVDAVLRDSDQTSRSGFIR
jgi:hypothetical protein